MRERGIGLKRLQLAAGICLLLAAGILFGKESAAFAETYFNWKDMEHYDVSAQNGDYEGVAVAYDDEFLYLHAIEKEGKADSFLDSAAPVIYYEGGKQAVSLSDAECTSTKEDGKLAWEAVIPLEGITDLLYVSMNVANEWWELRLNFLARRVDDAYIKPSDYIHFGGGNIAIDGYYDDWEDKPHALVTNKGVPDSLRTEDNCRQLSMFYDDEYVYFHLKMESNGKDPFKGEFFEIWIGGKLIEFHICYEDGKKFFSRGMKDGTYKAYVYFNGTHWEYAPPKVEDAYAYVTVGEIDECEVALPLTMWRTVYGITLRDVKEVRMRCMGIFIDEVCSAGSSSGPALGVAICAALSVVGAAGVWWKKRK